MNANNGGNNNNTKRKPNNMQRHNNNNNNNNRNRRFTNNGNGNRSAAEDTANVARIRRNATQSREKYQNMARDALSMGDRVLSENYLQHAEHYYRVLMELPAEEVKQPTPPRQHNHNQQQSATNEAAPVTEHTEAAEAIPEQPVVEQETPADSLPAFITQPVPVAVAPENTQES